MVKRLGPMNYLVKIGDQTKKFMWIILWQHTGILAIELQRMTGIYCHLDHL